MRRKVKALLIGLAILPAMKTNAGEIVLQGAGFEHSVEIGSAQPSTLPVSQSLLYGKPAAPEDHAIQSDESLCLSTPQFQLAGEILYATRFNRESIRYGEGLQYNPQIDRAANFNYRPDMRYGFNIQYGSGIAYGSGIEYGSRIPRKRRNNYDPSFQYGDKVPDYGRTIQYGGGWRR